MNNATKMKRDIVKYLIISIIGAFCLSTFPVREAHAQPKDYADSVTFKIDSARIEGNDLTFSIMFWRINRNWQEEPGRLQDTVLGNTDLYFWMEDAVFNKSVAPALVRVHPGLGTPSFPGSKLLQATTEYHAYRLLITLKPQATIISPGASDVVSILYQEPQELCRVRLRMSDPQQNPGLRWDAGEKGASAGQSAAGEPLIAYFNGDVISNPDKNIRLVDHSKKIYACEGGTAQAWVKGHSSGTHLLTHFYISAQPDCINSTHVKISSATPGNYPPGLVQETGTVSSPWGDLDYAIRCGTDGGLERVDTLYLKNVPKALHELYVQYELTDDSYAARAASVNGVDPSQIFVRDSLHAWFATSDPTRRDDYFTTNIGATERTDTVLKCTDGGAILSFYFFGPQQNEDDEVIGSAMNVTYRHRDALGNSNTHTVPVTSWGLETEKAPDGVRPLYRGTITIDPSISEQWVWVESISTANGCNNGGSYGPYDTVWVQTVEPDQAIVAILTDTTLAVGATMVLTSAFTYSDVVLQPGTAGGRLSLNKRNYLAPELSCGDSNGCTDTLLYYYDVDLGGGNTCQMEVKQAVIISEEFYLSAKVFLEGAFVFSTDGLMLALSPYLFPRSGSTGAFESPYEPHELITSLPAITGAGGEEITDWIEICLRDASNVGYPLVLVDSVSAFVRQDGQVFGTDGEPYVKFKDLPKKNYHVIVRHRNHLGVMSKNEVQLQTSASVVTATPSIDFTNISNAYTSTLQPVMQTGGTIPAGKAALLLGDVTGDGVISMVDANEIVFTVSSGKYLPGDVNFDEFVNMNDFNKVLPQNSLRTQY